MNLRSHPWLLAIAAALALPASIAAQSLPATTLRVADLRVASIAYRIGVAGVGFCGDKYPLTGLLLHHLPEYDRPGRAIQIERYRLDRGPGVLAIVADGPAARAGLLAGDVLLAVNGMAFPDPRAMAAQRDSKVWRQAIEASEAQLEEALRRGPAELRILRKGEELRISLGSIPACPIRIRLAQSNQANAFANGRYVILTSKMIRFVRSDDELAIMIGHELAHNILNHKDRLEAQNVPRGLLRSIGKNASRVRVTEEEAERFGLQLAWAAGYDVDAAIPFWRRFYAAHGAGPQIFRTHPSLRAREKLIADTIAELQGLPVPAPAAR